MEHRSDRQEHHQESADKVAAERREADLASASESLAEQRAAEDEATTARRQDEDDATAAARREADRAVVSARTRLVTAAAALQLAVDAEDLEEVRVANAEIQAAVGHHLDVVPEVSAPSE